MSAALPNLARVRVRKSVIFSLALLSLALYYLCYSGGPEVELPALDPGGLGLRLSVGVVVASMKADDTRWMKKLFPHWNVYRYVVDDKHAAYAVPKNKGMEAMPYLTHIIEHYDELDDVLIFSHPQRYQWHNDDKDHDGARVLRRLRLEHVQKEGYVSLRCAREPGCIPGLDLNDTDHDVGPEFPDRFTAAMVADAFPTLFPAQKRPDRLASGCCAQFAVSAARIRESPVEEYKRLRQWIFDGSFHWDAAIGRIYEYGWHVIFKKPMINCPEEQTCYCEAFGMCDLSCPGGACGVSSVYMAYRGPWYRTLKDWFPQ